MTCLLIEHTDTGLMPILRMVRKFAACADLDGMSKWAMSMVAKKIARITTCFGRAEAATSSAGMF